MTDAPVRDEMVRSIGAKLPNKMDLARLIAGPLTTCKSSIIAGEHDDWAEVRAAAEGLQKGFDLALTARISEEARAALTPSQVEAGEVGRLRDLLTRWLSAASGGNWRDKAGLSIATHPVADDTVEALAQSHGKEGG